MKERFQELLVKRVRQLKLGDPLDENVDLGPLIREAEAGRAEEWVKEAVAGARNFWRAGNAQALCRNRQF